MSQKNCMNFVAKDQIWKDHLATEVEAARKWPKQWGFLTIPIEELLKDEEKQPPKPKIPLPEHLQIRPVTPVEKYCHFPQWLEELNSVGWRSVVTPDPIGTPPTSPAPSPLTSWSLLLVIQPSPPVPQTTQGFIGWRSTVPGLELERYYQIKSCKGAFHKDLKWPNEPTD
ncbi:uncharacterized protein C20orf85 homolog [Sphaerodactylus townsendi]|uniref:uncharacterized protein C20orf85 homolog n=1 Tax=Sphaerodactylus townsendi TaxID=933632 RepID=UPI002025C168|nr:uncharacterized protein C20orf85 homolog [Sphaerodactylus townsendi]